VVYRKEIRCDVTSCTIAELEKWLAGFGLTFAGEGEPEGA
jgi:hypothetical protein